MVTRYRFWRFVEEFTAGFLVGIPLGLVAYSLKLLFY